MKRGHALLIALVIGAAALFGLVATVRTAQVARPAQQASLSTAEIAKQNRALSRQEAKLKRILAQQPVAARQAPAAPAQRITYVRPKPHIVTVHHAHGDEQEAEDGDREGGEFDD